MAFQAMHGQDARGTSPAHPERVEGGAGRSWFDGLTMSGCSVLSCHPLSMSFLRKQESRGGVRGAQASRHRRAW